MKTITELQKEVYANAKSKGFHEGEKNVGEMLCLIHSEVSEALEADRVEKYCDIHNDSWIIDGVTLVEDMKADDDIQFENVFKIHVKDTFEDELADVMIRVMDLAESKGIDLQTHIEAKMRYNSTREAKHGKKY